MKWLIIAAIVAAVAEAVLWMAAIYSAAHFVAKHW